MQVQRQRKKGKMKERKAKKKGKWKKRCKKGKGKSNASFMQKYKIKRGSMAENAVKAQARPAMHVKAQGQKAIGVCVVQKDDRDRQGHRKEKERHLSQPTPEVPGSSNPPQLPGRLREREREEFPCCTMCVGKCQKGV